MRDKEQSGFTPKDGSEPAYPVQGIRESEDSLKLYGQMFHGMTKREHFAAMALSGMSQYHKWGAEFIAAIAIEQADALLAALEKQQ